MKEVNQIRTKVYSQKIIYLKILLEKFLMDVRDNQLI